MFASPFENTTCCGCESSTLDSDFRAEDMNVAVHAGVTPESPLPTDPSLGDWKVWILGTLVTTLLSFTRGKWGPLPKLNEKVETTIKEAEQILDIVEEVAEKVEQVADEAAKNLPKGKLQDAAEFIEGMTEQIDKKAHLAGDVLQQVEEMGGPVPRFNSSSREDHIALSAEPIYRSEVGGYSLYHSHYCVNYSMRQIRD